MDILSAVAYVIGMVSADLLNVSYLCQEASRIIAKYLLTRCPQTRPWKLCIPIHKTGSFCFSYSMISV